MTELVDNVSQFLVALICTIVSGKLYTSARKRPYFHLTCFYGCFALGVLYWTLYYLLFSYTPQIFYVSETAWICSYIFLFILQYELSDASERAFRCKAAWIPLIVGGALCLFYCTYGEIIFNFVSCGMTILLGWISIRGLCYQKKRAGNGPDTFRFHRAVVLFVAVEYGLWTASCFWVSDTLSNPYFWFDFLLTATLASILPATRRAVENDLH